MPVPPLLEAFGRWLQDIPHGGLGYFDGLWGEPLDATYVRLDEDPVATEIAAENLRRRLGIFLHLPEGSRLALWYHGAGPPAVVLLGSEDARENIASSLEAFLVALSEGRTGVGELDDNRDGSRRPELQAWLAPGDERHGDERHVGRVVDASEPLEHAGRKTLQRLEEAEVAGSA
jgi:hypothetical protein